MDGCNQERGVTCSIVEKPDDRAILDFDPFAFADVNRARERGERFGRAIRAYDRRHGGWRGRRSLWTWLDKKLNLATGHRDERRGVKQRPQPTGI